MERVFFISADKGLWIETIVKALDKSKEFQESENVQLVIDENVKPSQLQSVHVVTYANLIQSLYDKGFQISQGGDEVIAKYLYHDLGLKHYWTRKENHVGTDRSGYLNLWRIIESEKDFFSKEVEQYFKNKYFKDKDLSAISLSLNEAFYNVYDHADAGNNAFIQIMYDEKDSMLSVAVSDFGKGIVGSVKEHVKESLTDVQALEMAIKDGFTVSSTSHNKGKGLDVILSCADVARILSGEAFLYKRRGEISSRKLNFSFPGTLIYYEIDLSKLDDIDILDEFSF